MDNQISKSVIRGIACGGTGGDPVILDSEDGRLVRIRPLRWNTNYTDEELSTRLWEFESRGKTLKCPEKSSPPYYALAYKTRVYSKNRVKYPLKRVDWEPGGNPEKINPQNRGRSKFERISWDEAVRIMHDEIQRMYDDYGPGAILAIGENGHKDSKVIHMGGGAHATLLGLLGGYTRETRTPDSVEGFYWGAKHVWGTGPYNGLGMANPYENIVKDVSDSDLLQFLVPTRRQHSRTSNDVNRFVGDIPQLHSSYRPSRCAMSMLSYLRYGIGGTILKVEYGSSE